VAATQLTETSAVATVAPTKAAGSGTAMVDLRFTGTLPISAQGTAGRCIVITRADGTVAFGFEATEADYAGLGVSFSMANLNADFVDIKWVVNGSVAYGDPGSGITLSPDHHAVQLDVELSPFTPNAKSPEHVKGSVSCP
jgi:hypothetical protein